MACLYIIENSVGYIFTGIVISERFEPARTSHWLDSIESLAPFADRWFHLYGRIYRAHLDECIYHAHLDERIYHAHLDGRIYHAHVM
jgi:hypothetical protein